MPRIGSVQRDAETEREIALEKGGVVADEVGAILVRDDRCDLLQESADARELSELRGRAIRRTAREGTAGAGRGAE